METTTRVRLLIEPLVDEAGVSLYDLEYAGGVLRITVQKDGGVDIGIIGKLTREISHLLDEEDPMPGQYTLEVSSPGLERPLRTPEHFAGAVGSVVALKTKAGVEGDRRIKGTLVAVDDGTATIAPADAAPGSTRILALDDIERARTVFEWGPAPKPGSGSKPGAAPKSASSAKKKKAAKS
ncbi:ribosome maturation factor RimP [Aquihabitans daechungensis]|uniref:ribosome maturation factor RimP n=1 Tax=Aquihabitans daechungensis TaxID=1052257 RepID=UPI003B9E3A3B